MSTNNEPDSGGLAAPAGAMQRRHFVRLALGTAAVTLAARGRLAAQTRRPRFRAIAFDAFPILDPRPVFALARRLFPEQGAALADIWRTRQFEYTWLRTSGAHYADFWQVTEEALVYAARSTGINLAADAHARLMNAYLGLQAWPDVLPVLRRFRTAGVACGFLSNFSPRMLAAAHASAALDGLMTHSLSTDAARTYKPDPRAYQLAVDAFGLPREDILFVPFAAWDAAGAKWFGFPTFWVNRLAQPAEELAPSVDGAGRDLNDLERFVHAI
ncbi:MAG TPA: haloacid dehalogenase type II [Lacunisphaera sp.]|nr:haloacid dehalogenase type II [Lacunisphaera sp.]